MLSWLARLSQISQISQLSLSSWISRSLGALAALGAPGSPLTPPPSELLRPRPPLVALVLCASIVGGEALGLGLAVAATALAGCLTCWRPAAAHRAVQRHLAIALAVLALGAAAQTWRGAAPLTDDDDRGDDEAAELQDELRDELRDDSRIIAERRGTVLRPAVRRSDGRHELLIELEDRTVRVYAPRPAAAGDEVLVTGRLRPPRGNRNPGSHDRAAAARREGIEAEMNAESLEVVGREGSWWRTTWRIAGALRDRWAVKILDQRAPRSDDESKADPVADPDPVPDPDPDPVPDPDPASVADPDPDPDPDPASLSAPSSLPRAVLLGVTLGLRAEIPPSLDERWRAVGIYHVLSVSGLHLAVVALFLFSALRRLAAALSTRVDPSLVALVPALLAATGYTMITGAQIATLRALLVAALWMIARASGRPLRLLDALALAAIALLLWSPSQLWQPSFQLSFAAALALARHRPAPLEPLPPRRSLRRFLPALARRLLGALGRAAATAAWVTLVTAPITAYHFHQLQPGGVLGNLLVTPLVELAALPAGLAGLVVGELSATAGAALITAAAAVVAFADHLAALLQPICPVAEVAIAAPLLAACAWALPTILCGRRRRGLVDLAAWCALCALWLAAPLAPPDGVRVTFLDVGQGDAALLETPSQLWLIDAGGAPGASTITAAAAPGRAIARLLELLDRRHLDVVVISHPHPDHYLGLLALEGLVTIGELWLPPGFVDEPGGPDYTGERSDASSRREGRVDGHRPATPSFRDVVAGLRRAGTVVHPPPAAGRTSREGARLTVIAPRYREHPGAPERLAADPIRTVNDNSAVVTLEYAGRRVLFPGDVELEGEDALVAALPPAALRADIVKVPHHGSRTSSTEPFIAAARAQLAIVSCGAGNRFGFPAPEVVERWRRSGAAVLRTDRGGAVIVELSADGGIEVRRP